jgi:hypothetical protein
LILLQNSNKKKLKLEKNNYLEYQEIYSTCHKYLNSIPSDRSLLQFTRDNNLPYATCNIIRNNKVYTKRFFPLFLIKLYKLATGIDIEKKIVFYPIKKNI